MDVKDVNVKEKKSKKGSVADANIREPKYRIQTRIRP